MEYGPSVVAKCPHVTQERDRAVRPGVSFVFLPGGSNGFRPDWQEMAVRERPKRHLPQACVVLRPQDVGGGRGRCARVVLRIVGRHAHENGTIP